MNVVDETAERRRETGARVRQLRQKKQLSLRALAAALDVSTGTMSAIENGKTAVSVERLWAIAAALGASPASLVSPVAVTAEVPSGGADWRTFGPLDLDPVMLGAIEAFVATGYHGASMRTIAANAGMSVPGVYHHYASKQELLVRAFDHTMDELDERLAAARAEGTNPLERLAFAVEALALFHTLRSEFAFLGASEMRSLEQPERDRIAARRSALQRLIDAEIDAALAAGLATTTTPRETGRAIATMCTSLPQWFTLDGATSPQQIAQEYAQLALRMIGAATGPTDRR